MLNVDIYNFYGSKKLATFSKGECSGLTFSKEVPGGCIAADFSVAADFDQDHDWAKRHNIVEIFHESKRVWKGLVYSVGRSWGPEQTDIVIGCAGLSFKLNKLTTTVDLSGEKGSTWMTDHLVTHGKLRQWVKAWDIETTDYTIPDTIDVDRYETLNGMIEAINKFNGFEWGIDQDFTFFFRPYRVQKAAYITDLQHSEGAILRDLGDYADKIQYKYDNLAGNPASNKTSTEDTDLPVPICEIIDIPGLNSAAQALQYATIALDEALVSGSSTEVTATRIWNRANVPVHPSEVEPGKAVFIRGILPGRKQPGEFFEPDDISTFMIKTMTYNDDNESVSLGPGRVADKLEVLLARIEG
jgi:hypothetical protein